MIWIMGKKKAAHILFFRSGACVYVYACMYVCMYVCMNE